MLILSFKTLRTTQETFRESHKLRKPPLPFLRTEYPIPHDPPRIPLPLKGAKVVVAVFSTHACDAISPTATPAVQRPPVDKVTPRWYGPGILKPRSQRLVSAIALAPSSVREGAKLAFGNRRSASCASVSTAC